MNQSCEIGVKNKRLLLTHSCPPFQDLLSERLMSLSIMGLPRVPFVPLRDDSALRVISCLRGLRWAPEVPPLCRETQSLGQHMLERWEKMG